MGTLVAWHYPTPLFLKLADHTYVTCGNGAVRWKCWGGNTGGKALRLGMGSTNRADAIAEPDQKAGITCYLINGVCHQAANRILFPSRITVRGAKGYYVSEALYGTYGRPRGFLGFCQAPFYQHSTVSGDLAECQSELLKFTGKDLESVDQVLDQPGESPGFQDYIDRVASLYEQADVKGLEDDYDQLSRFQVRLFEEMVGFKLSSSYLDTDNASTIMEIRREYEDRRYTIEESFQAEEVAVGEFLDGYNHLTLDFQHQLADALSESDYRRLLGLNRDETVVLGDPDIIHQAYNRGD